MISVIGSLSVKPYIEDVEENNKPFILFFLHASKTDKVPLTLTSTALLGFSIACCNLDSAAKWKTKSHPWLICCTALKSQTSILWLAANLLK